MNREVGTVTSTMEGPSPNQVDFIVTSGRIHRGQFVEVDYSEGRMVCLVTDVLKTNRYFERAESVKEFESTGKPLKEQFPVHEWEYLLAKSKPLGVFDKTGKSHRPSFPPSPGTKVLEPDTALLQSFLGLDLQNGLQVGRAEFHDLDIKLNLTKLFQKHVAILAQSGSGKSYSVSVLLEELLSRKPEQGRLGIVLIDTHGEYRNFADPVTQAGRKDYSSQTKWVNSKDLRIGTAKAGMGTFSLLLPDLTSIQKREISQAVDALKKTMESGQGPFTIKEVIDYVNNFGEKSKTSKESTASKLHELEMLNLFGKMDSFSLTEIVKPGQLTLIDLASETNQKRKQSIVAYLSNHLFMARRSGDIPPFLLIVEESHQFAPEGATADRSISKYALETIAREGRKFGASLCLISQRPKRLSTTILANCNTNWILRITNPYDLKHLSESAEGIDSDSMSMISSLRVGEALLVGEGVSYPVFFKVRQRYSQDNTHEVTLEEAARRFEEQKQKANQETRDLL